ncbi:hypothetical protein E3U55_14475 [Filobacillus milosensis]|uniref:Lipoprotein n=1 Tax=Filobacillus milosensis TaxID=94137 RepID=A0A4Y8IDQ6_9BACI|nr:hypothetical protein [Filobacillus milosensis]TFB14118.1 hypothetical protein E3U55_14475 [Filobacillus milosensis]
MKLTKVLPLFLLIILLVACDDKQHLTFETSEEAEREIGAIKTPVMPENYTTKKITYENDSFTHPVTKVFYEKGRKEITFMNCVIMVF